MKISDRIIRSRGEVPLNERREPPGGEFEHYEAYRRTDGFPQMGFSIFTRSGTRHAFFYHNMDNLDLVEKGEDEFVNFTHRGKAVTMRGRDLHGLVEAILAHTLQAVYEYDSGLYAPIAAGARIIDRIAVTMAVAPAPAPGRRDREAPQ